MAGPGARKNATAEAARAAWAATHRYLDDSASIGHSYLGLWGAASQAGLRATFGFQNSLLEASRLLLDASARASSDWLDQTTESVRRGQNATAELVALGFQSVESALPKPRG